VTRVMRDRIIAKKDYQYDSNDSHYDHGLFCFAFHIFFILQKDYK
jgi:hypothetical protein